MRKDTYATVVPKILTLTHFGTRVETAEAPGWKIAWSNGNRNWGRWMSPIKRGQQVNLDANQVIVYGPARYVDALCKNLPAPPIDAYSAEARFDRGPEEFLSNPRPPSPEEEWLGGEESGDPGPTGEGDLAPWMKPGSGGFPMESRVTYINAYTLLEYRVGFGMEDNLRRYGNSHKVGLMPPGVSIGSDSFYTPFASIPVRHEDHQAKDFFFAYLEWLVKGVKLGFTRIETEEQFPRAEANPYSGKVEGRVTLADGRWFPYETTAPFSHPALQFVNGYSVNRVLGGEEEGGWWYDEGIALASIPFKRGFDETEKKWKLLMQNAIGWHSKYPLGSVLGRDEFRMTTEDSFAKDWPDEKPHYE